MHDEQCLCLFCRIGIPDRMDFSNDILVPLRSIGAACDSYDQEVLDAFFEKAELKRWGLLVLH